MSLGRFPWSKMAKANSFLDAFSMTLLPFLYYHFFTTIHNYYKGSELQCFLLPFRVVFRGNCQRQLLEVVSVSGDKGSFRGSPFEAIPSVASPRINFQLPSRAFEQFVTSPWQVARVIQGKIVLLGIQGKFLGCSWWQQSGVLGQTGRSSKA